MSVTSLFSIGVGGFFGAICRFFVANRLTVWLGSAFPYGTLAVNALGSLLLGFLSGYLVEHLTVNELVRMGVTIGFLGAFTTFSTFSYESVTFILHGDIVKAGANILANCAICVTLCLLGVHLARSF